MLEMAFWFTGGGEWEKEWRTEREAEGEGRTSFVKKVK